MNKKTVWIIYYISFAGMLFVSLMVLNNEPLQKNILELLAWSQNYSEPRPHWIAIVLSFLKIILKISFLGIILGGGIQYFQEVKNLIFRIYSVYSQIETAISPKLYRRFYTIGRLIIGLMVFFIFFSKLGEIYSIPVSKPYFTGTYDEPLPINSGIKFLKTGGDHGFYNYGGTTAIPHAVLFKIHQWLFGSDVYFKDFDERIETYEKLMTWTPIWKFEPVAPAYWGEVYAIVLFIMIGGIITGLISVFLLPIPLFFSGMLFWGEVTWFWRQLLPEAQSFLYGGLTCVIFLLTLFRSSRDSYYRYSLICAITASVAVATKIGAAYIIILPLSLLIRVLWENKNSDMWKKKIIFFLVCLIIPYIMLNPAVIVNPVHYLSWLTQTLSAGGGAVGIWQSRLGFIPKVLNEIYIFHYFPASLCIILLVMFFFITFHFRKYELIGLFIFITLSVFMILNVNLDRFKLNYFMSLYIPITLLFLLPFIFIYNKKPLLQILMLYGGIVFSIIYFPYQGVYAGVIHVFSDTFTINWQRESRDELIDFLQNSDRKIYFFDVHDINLPEIPFNKNLIPFIQLSEIPEKLKENEWIGIIKYQSCSMEKYLNGIQVLNQRYKPDKTFGNPDGQYDCIAQYPKINPSIILMKNR
ncbi:MAG: hypothetical protein HQM12_16750 [SAR324 cluster bacterium]|nr:hypothetical protein [SAR324 cluster bacterium]